MMLPEEWNGVGGPIEHQRMSLQAEGVAPCPDRPEATLDLIGHNPEEDGEGEEPQEIGDIDDNKCPEEQHHNH